MQVRSSSPGFGDLTDSRTAFARTVRRRQSREMWTRRSAVPLPIDRPDSGGQRRGRHGATRVTAQQFDPLANSCAFPGCSGHPRGGRRRASTGQNLHPCCGLTATDDQQPHPCTLLTLPQESDVRGHRSTTRIELDARMWRTSHWSSFREHMPAAAGTTHVLVPLVNAHQPSSNFAGVTGRASD